MSSALNLEHALRGGIDVGGKARNIARLLAEGLPCPEGFVVPATSLRDMSDSERSALFERICAALPAPLAVRSSASIEDSATSAAPGLFHSELGVSHEDLGAAVDRVVASARVAAVQSYCQLRGIPEEAVEIAVIVQRQIAPIRAAGVIYTRPPGRPKDDTLIIDISESPTGPWTSERSRQTPAAVPPLDEESWQLLSRAALASERAIEARDGADIEWVIDDSGGVWIVQARPIVHPAGTPPPALSLFRFSRDDYRVWTWDVTHNPDPLSPAQAGLVQRVGDASGTVEMRMVGGYLYTAPRQEPVAPAELPRRPGALARFIAEEITSEVDKILGPFESGDASDFAAALEAYRRVIELYSQRVSPTLKSCRDALQGFLNRCAGEAHSQLMATLLATRSDRHLAARIRRVARGDESIDSLLVYAAPMAPAWDVAAPTFAEDPSQILDAVELERQRQSSHDAEDTVEATAEAIRLRTSLCAEEREEFDQVLERAREAQELGETDDHIFFRAQAMMRRALLTIAREWGLSNPGDVFFLELDWIEELVSHSQVPTTQEVALRVELATQERAREKSQRMPLEFRRGRPRTVSPKNLGLEAWRGVGCGGRARGRVVKVRDLGRIDAQTENMVILARAISPSLLFRVSGAAALVSAYGGPLGHGAAMARELEIPCVVRCPGAWEALEEGEDVWVDGDSGLVVRAQSKGQR